MKRNRNSSKVLNCEFAGFRQSLIRLSLSMPLIYWAIISILFWAYIQSNFLELLLWRQLSKPKSTSKFEMHSYLSSKSSGFRGTKQCGINLLPGPCWFKLWLLGYVGHIQLKIPGTYFMLTHTLYLLYVNQTNNWYKDRFDLCLTYFYIY